MLKEVQSRNGICDSLGLLFLEDEACIRLSTIRCCTWFLLKGFLNEVEIGASSLVMSCSLASWDLQLDNPLANLSGLKES